MAEPTPQNVDKRDRALDGPVPGDGGAELSLAFRPSFPCLLEAPLRQPNDAPPGIKAGRRLLADVVVAEAAVDARQRLATLAAGGKGVEPQLPAAAEGAVDLDHALGHAADTGVESNLFSDLGLLYDEYTIEVAGPFLVLDLNELGRSAGSGDSLQLLVSGNAGLDGRDDAVFSLAASS